MENQTNFFKEIQVKKTSEDAQAKSYKSGTNEIFNPDIKPITWNNQLDKNDCIHIIGDLNPVKFMNALMNQNKLFLEFELTPKKDELEFFASYFEDLEIFIELTIKLYQTTDGYIIGFILKQSGDENVFPNWKNKISKYVEEMLC